MTDQKRWLKDCRRSKRLILHCDPGQGSESYLTMGATESDQEKRDQNCNEKTDDETRFLVEEIMKPKDLDGVLLESVGKFGLFQAWLLL